MRSITLTLLMFSFCAFAKPENGDDDFDRQIDVRDVGQARIISKWIGEPVINARMLKVLIRCKGTKKWQVFIDHQICRLNKYNYDSKERRLTLEYTNGRVKPDTGETFCDQLQPEKTFPLADVCKGGGAPLRSGQ